MGFSAVQKPLASHEFLTQSGVEPNPKGDFEPLDTARVADGPQPFSTSGPTINPLGSGTLLGARLDRLKGHQKMTLHPAASKETETIDLLPGLQESRVGMLGPPSNGCRVGHPHDLDRHLENSERMLDG